MKKLLILIFLFPVFLLSAQSKIDSKKIDLSQGTIKDKFETVYNKSNNYKDYKVIKKYVLIQLKKQVFDSLKNQKNLNKMSLENNRKLKQKITDLASEIKSSNAKIQQLENDKDSIGFLGMSVKKSRYQLIMWSLVTILVLALLYFIFMFKNSHQVTKTAKNNLLKIEEEYNNFRTNALEREQMLKRQLLDEQKKHQS